MLRTEIATSAGPSRRHGLPGGLPKRAALARAVHSFRKELVQFLIGVRAGSLPVVYGEKGVVASRIDEIMGCAPAVLRDALFDSLDGLPFVGRVRGRTVLRAASIIKVSLQRIAIFPQPIEKLDNLERSLLRRLSSTSADLE